MAALSAVHADGESAAHVQRGPTVLAAANIAAKVTAVALSAYPLSELDRPQFRGKAMRPRAILYPLIPLAVPLTWLRRGRPSPYPHAADLALSLPLVLDAGANTLDVYRRVKNFDLLVHTVNALCGVIAFGAALSPLMPNRWSAAALATSLGISGAALWEVAEYAALKSGERGLDLTYENTMLDVLTSAIGAAIGGAVTAAVLWPRRAEVGALFGWRLVERPHRPLRRLDEPAAK